MTYIILAVSLNVTLKWSLSQLLEVSITGADGRQTENAESWVFCSFSDMFFMSVYKKPNSVLWKGLKQTQVGLIYVNKYCVCVEPSWPVDI